MDDALTSGAGPLWAGATRMPLRRKCIARGVSKMARYNQFMAGVMATTPTLTAAVAIVQHTRAVS